MTELLKTLCALPGPSGCEDAVRAFVLKQAKPFADEIKTDAIGNVMVFRKGKAALGCGLRAHGRGRCDCQKDHRGRHAEIRLCRRG